MMGLSNEFAYPSHKNNELNEVGISDWSCKNGRTNANTKNGNQHIVKALIIIPNVVEAFLSLAN